LQWAGGTAFSNLIGGPITDLLYWRTAFFVVGLLGLAGAMVLRLAVKEPPRGYTDPPGVEKPEHTTPSFAIRELLPKPSHIRESSPASNVR
jgi:MFS family permease